MKGALKMTRRVLETAQFVIQGALAIVDAALLWCGQEGEEDDE